MKKNIVFMAALLTAALFGGCGNQPQPIETTDSVESNNVIQLNDAQLASVGITTDSLKQMALSRVVHLHGQVKVPPQNVYSMSVPVGGYVTSTSLVPGARVKRGQQVATLEDLQYIDLQEQYVSLKSRLNMLQADYERQRTLNESKASSDHDFQMAKSEWESAVVALRALKEKLALLHIDADGLQSSNISRSITLYAPFDGFVSKVNVNTGKYINPSDVMFEFIHAEDCYLGMTVFEEDMRELQAGMKLRAVGNNSVDSLWCEIQFVQANLSDQHSGEAICKFTEAPLNVVPGMFMQADVALGVQLVSAMPVDGVVHYEGKNFIFACNDSRSFEMLEVETGDEENGMIAVTLKQSLSGRQVVHKGAYALLMAFVNQSE